MTVTFANVRVIASLSGVLIQVPAIRKQFHVGRCFKPENRVSLSRYQGIIQRGNYGVIWLPCSRTLQPETR